MWAASRTRTPGDAGERRLALAAGVHTQTRRHALGGGGVWSAGAGHAPARPITGRRSRGRSNGRKRQEEEVSDASAVSRLSEDHPRRGKAAAAHENTHRRETVPVLVLRRALHTVRSGLVKIITFVTCAGKMSHLNTFKMMSAKSILRKIELKFSEVPKQNHPAILHLQFFS